MRKHSITSKELTNLRVLRLWHWRKVVGNRTNQRMYEEEARRQRDKYPDKPAASKYSVKKAKQAGGLADFHLKAVQFLNDVVPGTAEDDASVAEAIRKEREQSRKRTHPALQEET